MVLFEKISSYARSNRDYGSKDILKYFGLYLDSPFDVQVSFWPFDPPIQEDSDHLLPNIEKSEVNVYRLYVGIVWNMTLYDVLVWAIDLWRRVDKHWLAIRFIRKYRTVLYAAAMILAGSLSFYLLAESSNPVKIFDLIQVAKRQTQLAARAKWEDKLYNFVSASTDDFVGLG